MWRIANVLKQGGISSFNGYQVTGGGDWQEEWYGTLPETSVLLPLFSPQYFGSGPCTNEVLTGLKQSGLAVIPINFGLPSMKGHFLGEGKDNIKKANLIKQRLGNCVPPPDQGTFDDNFQANATALVKLVRDILGLPPLSATTLAAAPLPPLPPCPSNSIGISLSTPFEAGAEAKTQRWQEQSPKLRQKPREPRRQKPRELRRQKPKKVQR